MNTTKKTATFIRTTTTGPVAHQRLYHLSPPLESWEGLPSEYVIAYASFLANAVYLLPSDAQGEIQDWNELPGSMKNTMSHEDALENAGYEVQP